MSASANPAALLTDFTLKSLVQTVCYQLHELAMVRLVAAAREGDVEEVRRLLAAGVDVNAKDDDGAPVLISAAYQGHLPVVELLLQQIETADVILANKCDLASEEELRATQRQLRLPERL